MPATERIEHGTEIASVHAYLNRVSRRRVMLSKEAGRSNDATIWSIP